MEESWTVPTLSDQDTFMELISLLSDQAGSYTHWFRGFLPLLSSQAHNLLPFVLIEGCLSSVTVCNHSQILSVGYFNIDHSDYVSLFRTTVVGSKMKLLYCFFHSFNTSIFSLVVVLFIHHLSVELNSGCNRLSSYSLYFNIIVFVTKKKFYCPNQQKNKILYWIRFLVHPLNTIS